MASCVERAYARSRAKGAADAQPPPQPKCGDTITTDTTLHHNLVNCPNNGIVIGADNVTLDLNYHTIDGDGTPASGCNPNTEVCDVGVVNDGHDGVTVVHGSVREFEVGVGIGEPGNRVLGVSCVEEPLLRPRLLPLRSESGAKQRRKPDEGRC